MQTFGLLYLIAYLLDCVGSILGTLLPAFEPLSDAVSILVSLCTLVVFVLACVGKLRPRRVFLALSIFYILLLVFGMVLGVMLVLATYQKTFSGEVTIQTLFQQFPWYPAVHWALMVVWFALAVWGLSTRLASGKTIESTDEVGGARP